VAGAARYNPPPSAAVAVPAACPHHRDAACRPPAATPPPATREGAQVAWPGSSGRVGPGGAAATTGPVPSAGGGRCPAGCRRGGEGEPVPEAAGFPRAGGTALGGSGWGGSPECSGQELARGLWLGQHRSCECCQCRSVKSE